MMQAPMYLKVGANILTYAATHYVSLGLGLEIIEERIR